MFAPKHFNKNTLQTLKIFGGVKRIKKNQTKNHNTRRNFKLNVSKCGFKTNEQTFFL
jgi:hypothetical protein